MSSLSPAVSITRRATSPAVTSNDATGAVVVDGAGAGGGALHATAAAASDSHDTRSCSANRIQSAASPLGGASVQAITSGSPPDVAARWAAKHRR